MTSFLQTEVERNLLLGQKYAAGPATASRWGGRGRKKAGGPTVCAGTDR